jgi:hypothetical protein
MDKVKEMLQECLKNRKKYGAVYPKEVEKKLDEMEKKKKEPRWWEDILD